jgi:U3 small nucleolar ribonucleoprotein component
VGHYTFKGNIRKLFGNENAATRKKREQVLKETENQLLEKTESNEASDREKALMEMGNKDTTPDATEANA